MTRGGEIHRHTINIAYGGFEVERARDLPRGCLVAIINPIDVERMNRKLHKTFREHYKMIFDPPIGRQAKRLAPESRKNKRFFF